MASTPEILYEGSSDDLCSGTSLVDQWLRLCAPNVGGSGPIPGQGTTLHMLQPSIYMLQLKILHAATETEHSQINKKKKRKRQSSVQGYNHAVREIGWVSQNTSLDASEQSWLIRKGRKTDDAGQGAGCGHYT